MITPSAQMLLNLANMTCSTSMEAEEQEAGRPADTVEQEAEQVQDATEVQDAKQQAPGSSEDLEQAARKEVEAAPAHAEERDRYPHHP